MRSLLASYFLISTLLTSCMTDGQKLAKAIEKNKEETVDSILRKDPFLAESDVEGVPILLFTARKANESTLLRVLEFAKDMNVKDEDNVSCIHESVALNWPTAVQTLIKKGANINAVDWSKSSPLHYAAECGNDNATRVLIKEGAKIELKNSDGLTPLAVAIDNGHFDLAQLLLLKGAKVDSLFGVEKRSVLHQVARAGKISLIEPILRNGGDVNALNIRGITPLHEAVAFGHLEAAKLLIEKGANINSCNKHTTFSISVAVIERYKNLVEFLTLNGADINAQDKVEGKSALHYAMLNSQPVIAQFLLGQPNIKLTNQDSRGNTPIHYALEQTYWKLVISKATAKELDICNKKGFAPLHIAAWNENVDAVKLILKKGANPRIKVSGGKTPLQYVQEQDFKRTPETETIISILREAEKGKPE